MGLTRTLTASESNTFIITHARYVTSKIAADLQQVRLYYNFPSEKDITDYAEEAAQLLAKRCLETVEYGFRKDGLTLFALKYIARSDGTLTSDDRPGRIPPGLNLVGASWYSFLWHSPAYSQLSTSDKAALVEKLPVNRGNGNAPVAGSGYWEENRTYSANGTGVVRHVFRPL